MPNQIQNLFRDPQLIPNVRFTALPQWLGRKDDMPHVVKILDVQQETPLVKTFMLDVSVGGQPGQFVNLWIPRVDEKPFSIAFDDGETLKLSIANVGTFTDVLFQKKKGDTVGVRGPYGRTFEYEKGEHLAVVGGGYGAAPLYFLASRALEKKCSIQFIIGARSKEHLLFVDRARALKDVTVHVATDDGSAGFKGYNAQLFSKLLKEKDGVKVDRVFAVGPELMMKAISDLALENDIPCQVSIERYMKCGFGICGQCVMDDGGIVTCMKGPVMDHLIARKQVEFGKYHRDKVGRKVKF